MIITPAIDIQNGSCVRLVRGDPATANIFSDNPTDQAATFAAAGCSRIHVVDLDGAFAGHPANVSAVEAIIGKVNLEVQLGGGIRDLATAESWLEKGIQQVILGTAAVEDRRLVAEIVKKNPGRIIGGIDAKNGYAATRGWVKTSSVRAVDLALQLEDLGISSIIFTDIDRDGAMGGPNLEAVAEMAAAVGIPVYASGGVSSMQDLRRLAALDAGVHGVIVGRAIYDGSIDLKVALKEFPGHGGGNQVMS